jgi:hypothetical protein
MNKIITVALAGMGICAGAFADQATPAPAGQLQEMKLLPPMHPFNELNCLAWTGSRVSSSTSSCVNAHGRVYTDEDVTASGATTWGAVLSSDPSITIRRR